MIRKRPELDTENPPGQIISSRHMEQPLSKNIEDFLMDTEELFTPQPTMSIHFRVRRILKGG